MDFPELPEKTEAIACVDARRGESCKRADATKLIAHGIPLVRPRQCAHQREEDNSRALPSSSPAPVSMCFPVPLSLSVNDSTRSPPSGLRAVKFPTLTSE